jgi:myo-inositol-1(or 4)-monophosphatase
VGRRDSRGDNDPHRRPAGDPLNDDLALAQRCARAAGALLLERFGGPAVGVESKSSSTDMVSDADRAAEEAITALLAGSRPDDGILGEEGASVEAASGRRWVVDPLDGTTNYLYGHPEWAVSVALEDASGWLVGVVFAPVAGELFAAARGEGATLNGSPIHVRTVATSLSRALVATGFGYDPDRRAMQASVLQRVLPAVRDIRRGGAAAIDLAWVAAGRVDAYYERGPQRWDWAAGRLLVEEAGGVVLDLPGEPHGVLAASEPLARPLYELVA